MLVHRRSLHKFERHQELELDSLIKVFFSFLYYFVLTHELEEDSRISSIDKVLRRNVNTKEYYCSFKDGTQGWVTILQDSNPTVQVFLSAFNAEIEEFEVNSGAWIKKIWEKAL